MKTNASILLKLCAITAMALAVTACGGGGDDDANEHVDNSTQYKTVDDDDNKTGSTTPTPATVPAAATIASGKALYTQSCASCHGANMPNARDSARTLSAIASNKGGMGFLSTSIKTAQANDIAAYLTYGL